MDNKTKIALVTGGSRGLGRDMALRLAEKGLDVIITYHSREKEASEVVALIEKAGQKAASLQLNTADFSGSSLFATQLQDVLKNTFGATHFDYLVNNAGTGGYGLIADIGEELFDELYHIHFKSVYFITQKMLPLLNEGGGIVNVSSGLTRTTVAGSSAYAAMKGAIEVFTRYLAKELGVRGIRANTIAPGAVLTDFGGGRLRNDENLQKFISSITPLGRPGVAEDIGSVVAFLCSEESRWVNGQRIEVSGGMNV